MHDLVRKVRLGNLQPPPCCWEEARSPAQSTAPRQPAARTADQSQPNSATKKPKTSIITAATSSIFCWKVTYFCQPSAECAQSHGHAVRGWYHSGPVWGPWRGQGPAACFQGWCWEWVLLLAYPGFFLSSCNNPLVCITVGNKWCMEAAE